MGKKEGLKSAGAFIAIVALLLALSLVISAITYFKRDTPLPASASPARTVVIDAGHGGMDGGAVAADGTPEKDINLHTAKILCALMQVSGYRVVMTRTDDTMLDTGDRVGSAKMRDLRRRLEIASSYPDAVLISIHCNKFPQESCKGLQVYHSDGESAQSFAHSVQESALNIMPENHRKIKKADSSIYLLHRAKIPSVLIECGFLSNASELASLKTTEYKKQLALVIMGGIDCAWTAG